MIFSANTQFYQDDLSQINYTGSKWTESIVNQLVMVKKSDENRFILDMSIIDFVPLFEWTSLVAGIDMFIANSFVGEFYIDLMGTKSLLPLSPNEMIKYEKKQLRSPFISDDQYNNSKRIYKVAGFLESLGTSSVLQKRIKYFRQDLKDANFRSFYTASGDEHTVVLGLTRINNKEDCLQFLDNVRIMSWVNSMAEEYRFSPLFQSQELWRVFCHELAANIWEHANAPGYISARIVKPFDTKNTIKRWCSYSYSFEFETLIKKMKQGFLEICVSDVGNGIVSTLREAYLKQQGRSEYDNNLDVNILKFAFDELGTCKNKDESWVAQRHALGRILQLVAKYGGGLLIKSGHAEIIYKGGEKRFKKLPNNFGYEPQYSRVLNREFKGTHLQLILPLTPQINQDNQERQSILYTTLPRGFKPQQNQVIGHLVPLLEKLDFPNPAIGKDEQKLFISKCKTLCSDLSIIHARPSLEPLIFDFSFLNWLPTQFETLLHLLQNVIQNRPVLLVELDPNLCSTVRTLEETNAPTTLAEDIISISENGYISEISEKTFLETYNLIHSTILGIDYNGVKHIFGLLNHKNYEQALISLILEPKTIPELTNKYKLNEGILNAIFNNINPLFKINKNGEWTTVWDERTIEIQSRRVMTLHFQEVVNVCQAWRGRDHIQQEKDFNRHGIQFRHDIKPDTGKEIFNVPWQEEWVKEFFESSRILSRGSYADEAAQRLIYRLEKGLRLFNKKLDDVKVLACVTAPALLLATAIYRWWPQKNRPSVADLGYYIMLNPNDNLPLINIDGGVVIIQDVLNKQQMSRLLVASLQEQKKEILCILSFARLVDEIKEPDSKSYPYINVLDDKFKDTRVSNVNEWTMANYNNSEIHEHAMIELKRPSSCNQPEINDEFSFWVEPRTLRPFRYTTLRGEARSRPEYNIDKNSRLRGLLEPEVNPIMAAGHYIFGNRHIMTTIDIQKFLNDPASSSIINWIADICEGNKNYQASWETKAGLALDGDVTAVLMPLHSQIHYLWPKVENLLAQRGRRQPVWFLDATLFLGHGNTYRMPLELEYQILTVFQDIKNDSKEISSLPLRILILDDSIVSGRTLETILLSLNQAVYNAQKKVNARPPQGFTPIKWTRYFALFNLLNTSHNSHWHNIKEVGKDFKIPFVFEEYVHLHGTPVYKDKSCPSCKDIRRLQNLVQRAEVHGITEAISWANQKIESIKPISMEYFGYHTPSAVKLKTPISLLPNLKKSEPSAIRGISSYVDSAIYRFYALMYMSYPPSDVLNSLDYNWSPPGPIYQPEYDRYRLTVFEWCLRNWPRIVADAAQSKFVEYSKKEAIANSFILEPLVEAMSIHRKDKYIKSFIGFCFKLLVDLEKNRYSNDPDVDQERRNRTLRLENALNLFVLNIPKEDLESYDIIDDTGNHIILFEYLQKLVKTIDYKGLSFIQNFCLQYSRPSRFALPEWALRTIAEHLFRGRDPNNPALGTHFLLPKLLKQIKEYPNNEELRRLLDYGLTTFMAALEDLIPYTQGWSLRSDSLNNVLSDSSTTMQGYADRIKKWLSEPCKDIDSIELIPEINHLIDEINLDSNFCKSFNQLFHPEIKTLRQLLIKRLNELKLPDLKFEFPANPLVDDIRILTLVHRLIFFISNWTIEPQKNYPNEHKSRIEVSAGDSDNYIIFTLLTHFDSLDRTNKMTVSGRKISFDIEALRPFGVVFDSQWNTPSKVYSGEFTAEFIFKVPIGFNPRR